MTVKCHYCGGENGPEGAELRPYGPDGSWVCFDCAMSSPERHIAARDVFLTQLRAALAAGEPVVVGESTGPRPMGGRKQ